MTTNTSPESNHSSNEQTEFDQALVDYFESTDAGVTLSLAELIEKYPNAETQIRDFLAMENRLGSIAPIASTKPDAFQECFKILKVLGQGGMGRVYLAFDPRLRRQVALKVPICDLRHNEEARERFFREGQIAASIQHPNVVTIYEFGEDDKQCFIVAEYVDGPTLHEWLVQRNEPLPVRTTATFVRALARAVQTAHARGILHRDLKPANVLLQTDDDGTGDDKSVVVVDGERVRPRITDFGLACFADDLASLTTTGAMIGTAAYMAPEQATGHPIGPQSDVFALGLILYEMLFGVRAFEDKSIVELVDRFRDRKPITLPESPTLPTDLRTICERSIQFDPEERYESAKDQADDLDRFLNGEALQATPVNWKSKLRRSSMRPIRVTQAAYAAIALQTCLFGSFVVVLLARTIGWNAGINGSVEELYSQVLPLLAFPVLPGLLGGIMTVRRNLAEYWANCFIAAAMTYMLLRCLVTGKSHLSYYDGNDLAFFIAHEKIFCMAVIQLVLHLLAIPSALQIRLQGYWPKA